MENIRIQMPRITIEQKKLIIKALNYYRIAAVEFSYVSDGVIFNAANLIEMIDEQSKIVKLRD